MTNFEVSKEDYIRIKKLFQDYVFNRSEEDRFFIRLTRKQEAMVRDEFKDVELNKVE